ncbi:bifunctional (p)ppGpp synthetase/guanosine-3',5'-bis(diphosphate) 3'-pyrophosphohydrolase [Actinomyces sp. zg-332]|uniref:RelA/SpoT family protein n=1 Tax=Actinomyces sp. zg-332 TaxID=2708340 RepID=UPI0014243B0F|nr:bifunctional (p)ppGpp synthetase/guanosine-3',5'-bis(diphosphate) 3'-pyrophosphohydrolase [Actinomyces sp. zg-332]QPK93660.1 bifunctional (p)ppGpp synthetase/guanosine-3',5'-bis(diphosphate) 3'-pyrophosphohydrolase [Actinomyces sp. zg-332]
MGKDNKNEITGSIPVVNASFVRTSLSWLGNRKRSTRPEIEPLIRAMKANHPKADTSLIEKAYDTARHLHEGQMRKSGEPYITHPVAVATILAELGMTPITLVAALLHDTVEDCEYTLEELTQDFGEEIALLVDGVTKLDKVEYGQAAKAETIRKMIVAMSKDIRVLVIKLGDRLHNARTWKYVSPESAKQKAKETLEIYAPLANRLGMNSVKSELEDKSFKILYPDVYEEINRLLLDRAPEREKYLNAIIYQIEEDLRVLKVKGKVSGRPKHHYSIYQKMVVRGRDFEDIYDLVAVRILVDTVTDCYAVLGAMHSRWTPIPGKFKDYIAMPKFNLYQSLHTTVIGQNGKPVEIQIRTHKMHYDAEYGVAAHWKYKENPNATAKNSDKMSTAQEMGWLRQLVEWQRETDDPSEFLDSLRYEVSGSEIYVFTPRGDVISLTRGASPVDFAYAVHTDVGHRTIGAKVNGKLVALDTKLSNGDRIEIITSKAQNYAPSRDWLKFVTTPRAKNKIKNWFSKERREEAIEQGKEQLAKTIRRQNLPLQRLLTQGVLSDLATEMGYSDISGIYLAIAENHLAPGTIVSKLIALIDEDSETDDLANETPIFPTKVRQPMKSSSNGVSVAGITDTEMLIKLAKCCLPVPGDGISGFITRGQGISVHRTDCANLQNLAKESERIIEVEWQHNPKAVYRVRIKIESIDREGLLAEISRVFADYHVKITDISLNTTSDCLAISYFSFDTVDPSHLNTVLSALRRLDGVYSVNRVTGSR